jgi:alpha/beta superfamily hydrolase
MARMSQTVKEVLQIVIFLAVVGLLLAVFVILPLNRTKAALARPDVDDFNADSLPLNDPTLFVEAGLVVDTFRLDADGLTNLACLIVQPTATDSLPVSPRGSAVLLHDEREDRSALIPLTRRLADSGFLVCIYDQRATGLSGGEYHGDGQLESTDLAEVIAYMAVRDEIIHPLVLVGYGVGADAVLLRGRDETRVDAVVAVDPYLTTDRWLDIIMAEHHMFWLPLSHYLFTFWYEMRSNYTIVDRTDEELQGVTHPTLVLVSEEHLQDREIQLLVERSGEGLVSAEAKPSDREKLTETVAGFVLLQLK